MVVIVEVLHFFEQLLPCVLIPWSLLVLKAFACLLDQFQFCSGTCQGLDLCWQQLVAVVLKFVQGLVHNCLWFRQLRIFYGKMYRYILLFSSVSA